MDGCETIAGIAKGRTNRMSHHRLLLMTVFQKSNDIFYAVKPNEVAVRIRNNNVIQLHFQ